MSIPEEKQDNHAVEAQEIEGKNVSGTVGKLIPVFVMGKRYEVPETLTIMKAMEYAGRLPVACRACLPDCGRAEYVPDADTLLPGQPGYLRFLSTHVRPGGDIQTLSRAFPLHCL